MKTVKLLSLSLIGIFVITLGSSPVFATTTDTTTGNPDSGGTPLNNRSATTDLNFSFKPGSLTIVNAPKTINFGMDNIEAESYTYYDSAPETIEISDLRGSGDGWNLTASASAFMDSTSSKTLPGAQILIPALSSDSITNPNSSAGTGPISNGNTFATLNTNNTAVPVLDAEKNCGTGDWTMSYPASTNKTSEMTPEHPSPKSFALVVPKPYAGMFTSKITWTLNAVPIS